MGLGRTADAAAFALRAMVFRPTAAGTALLFPAVRCLVYRRPRAALGLLLRCPTVFVAFFDVLSLSLLLVAILGFVTTGHNWLRLKLVVENKLQMAGRRRLI
jgi:hypothetical protein